MKKIENIYLIAKQLNSFGFSILEYDRFAEFYITELLGAKKEKRHSHCDCVLNNIRIEIKHSKLIDGYAKGYHWKYFHWGMLYGINKSKIGVVDTVILSGYGNDRWYFWVIPHNKVIRNEVEIQMTERRKKSYSWLNKYYVGNEIDLKRYFDVD